MNDDLEKIVRELKDRQEIHDCLVRYCHGMDRFDREMVRSAYHDDAIDDHGDFVGGVDGFIDWAMGYHTQLQQRTMHAISTVRIELDGDTAHSECYWTFTALNREAPFHNRATGRYIDRFERRDGRWAIAARICVMNALDEHLDPNGEVGDGNFFPTERGKGDPTYMRPLEVDRTRLTPVAAE